MKGLKSYHKQMKSKCVELIKHVILKIDSKIIDKKENVSIKKNNDIDKKDIVL